jgi:hypothetical protein
LAIKDTYEQVDELIWCHIKSLGDKEKQEFVYSEDSYSIDYASDYLEFKKKIKDFIKYMVNHKLSNIV